MKKAVAAATSRSQVLDELLNFGYFVIKLVQLIVSETKFCAVVVTSACVKIHEDVAALNRTDKPFFAEIFKHKNF